MAPLLIVSLPPQFTEFMGDFMQSTINRLCTFVHVYAQHFHVHEQMLNYRAQTCSNDFFPYVCGLMNRFISVVEAFMCKHKNVMQKSARTYQSIAVKFSTNTE